MTARAPALRVLGIVALACPTALAFASGGYFDDARLVALIAAWGLALAALVLGAPLPLGRAAVVAFGSLAGLTAWVWIAGSWAPLAATARGDLQRDVLYLGALGAAALLAPPVRRWVEPLLAAGAAVVIGYGLAGRLLPGAVTLTETASAGGRMDQPLTYWNATGALAALGLVLALRLAGEPARARALRAGGAAAAVPLCAGLVLTFSRGALIAAAVGVVLLAALCPSAGQLRAAACALVPGALGAFAATRSAAVRALEGDLATRERDGLVVLGVLVVLAGVAAALAWVAAGRPGPPRPPATRVAAAVTALALVAVPVATALAGSGGGQGAGFGASASRLGSATSNRADYWRVAWDATSVRGLGPGGFGPAWLRDRPYAEAVKDAHSLPIETVAELGLPGIALLAALAGAVVLGAGGALRRDAALAAGPAAVVATWFVHAAVDWDWEMPALTLVAVGCAGLLLSAPATPRRAG